MGQALVEGNASHIGRVGEFFAIYKLEKYGIECHHVDRYSHCRSSLQISVISIKTTNVEAYLVIVIT